MPEKEEEKKEPPATLDFGAWVQDPKNEGIAKAWAERNVAAPLKEKNSQLLEEKKSALEKLKAFEKAGGDDTETGKKGKYTEDDIKRLLGEKEKGFDAEKTQLTNYNLKLKGELQRQLIDGQLTSHLTKAGVKPSHVGLLVNFLKSPHDTGKDRIKISEEGDSFKIVIQDKNGSARFGKNEMLSLEELVAETKEGFKDLFLAPASGGSGNTGGGVKMGNSRYKISHEDWAALNSKEQGKYKFDDVAPPIERE